MGNAMIRYFRCSPSVYEAARATLNAAWGYPNAETKTETAIPPADELPSDEAGRVYLAVSADYCDYVLPAHMLPELLGSGDVEEIDEAAHLTVLPPTQMPG
jgi:hypothetical protein